MPDSRRRVGRTEVSKVNKAHEEKLRQRLARRHPLPRCPLCLEWMIEFVHPLKNVTVYACRADQIAIRPNDPFVGRWEEAAAKAKIPCHNPRCDETTMCYFATSVGFRKTKCPKCGATMSNKQPEDAPAVGTHAPEEPGLLQ